ncbi:GDSL lipase/acylhydrolase [Amylostereum chailletii]|nr:GDSL lipase/acylhydrolase [Amylostereum chailletii]
MSLKALLAASAAILFSSTVRAASASGPGPFTTLVTFGDSYTDVVSVGDGGTAWPVYAVGYANATLFPFARSGAPCSQHLTPRPFPSVFEDEIPAYTSEARNGTISVNPDNTLYTLWIGTNDLGPNTLLTGGVVNDTTIVEVTECAVGWVNAMYKLGARSFLFQNIIPLDRLPLYAVDSYPNRFWTLQRNTTEWHLFIKELSVSGNAISKLMLKALPAELSGAHIGLFDSHALFTDILDNPSNYLNGTAPLNTTGAINACVFKENTTISTCTVTTGTDRDSFVWFDELHPSEQSDRVVAREIANVLEGKGSKWATWFS